MKTGAEGDTLLTPIAAAHHLGITTELLFQFTKSSFGRSSDLRSLRTITGNGDAQLQRVL